MEKGPKPFQQVRAVDTVKIGGIYRDMRSIRGESVHSPRGDAGGEVLKGGRGRDGGGPLLRVPVVDDVAPVAVRALVPLLRLHVKDLRVQASARLRACLYCSASRPPPAIALPYILFRFLTFL